MTKTLSFWTRVGLASFILTLGIQLTLLATPDSPDTNTDENISCDVDGGYLTDSWLRTQRVICAGDGSSDAFDVLLEGDYGDGSAWVITDPNGNILGLPPAPPFDLEGAGQGTCLIWHLSFNGEISGVEVGKNAADLEGCYDLSNPITVYRNGVNGGTISTDDPTQICAGDGQADYIDVYVEGSEGPEAAWVITDQAGKILGLPAAPPFNFEGAGEGVCLIWYLRYEGPIDGLAMGKNANDFRGCYDLSNPITVYREGVDGGYLTTAGGMTEKTICAGDGESDAFGVNLTNVSGANSAWVITDDALNILALPPSPPFDLEGAGAGTCLIWHLSYEDGLSGAQVGMNAANLDGCYDLSNPITVYRETGKDCGDCDVEIGDISLADGSTSTSICVDGNPDPLHIVTSGGTPNVSTGWIITDDLGNILALPAGPPFDLDGAGVGTCEIWYLRYETIEGKAVGNNLSDLEGCYALSNPVTVVREAPDGGYVSLLDGSTTYTGTAGNIVFDVKHTTAAPNLSYWYIITDDNDNILGFLNSANGNTLDLSVAPPGECHIWGWSYRGLSDPVMGQHISTLADDDCEAISDNFITVIRNAEECGVEIGDISLADGSTSTSICVDGNPDPLHIVTSGGTPNVSTGWIITDDLGNILALPAGPPFDLDGAGVGTCEIWYLRYETIEGKAVGNNLSDLEGCYALSNPVTVVREAPDGGYVSLLDGSTTYTGTAGNIVFDVQHTTAAPNLSYWYIITDDNDYILGFLNSANGNTLDLSVAPPGECHIWGWSYRGLSDPVMGQHISTLADDDCEAISNNFITVIREDTDCNVNGGYLADSWLRTQRVICAGDGNSDAFDVLLSGQSGENSAWVITDQAGNILGLPAAPPFDLEGAGSGVCLIWHLSFDGEISGAEVGKNAADLEGCYDLSNPYTVYRNGVNGGTISTNDPTSICAGDGEDDLIDVYVEGSEGPNAAWVITDQAGKILGLPAAPPFNFEGAGEGVCLIWYLRYEGPLQGLEMGKNTNDFRGCYDFSNPITVYRDGVDGGYLTTAGGMTEKTICAGDGVSDAFDVNLTGATGANSAWVITDDALNILALPPSPPFDLEGAGEGTCLIWHLSYEDGLSGAQVGMNAANLEGCYNLSNPITVYRQTGEDCNDCGIETGDISLTNGNTSTSICVDGNPDPLDIITSGGTPNVSTGWIITDDAGNILALPAGPPFDLDGAGVGTCEIWYLRYESIAGNVVGNNLSDLAGCYALSNPVTVVREAPDGGYVSLLNGSTTYTGTAGNIVFDVQHTTAAANLSYWYIITDDNDNILGFLNSANGNTLDLSVAPPGECHVWGWSYRGLSDPVMGQHISTLADDDCEAISNNFITVIRTDDQCNVDGGYLTANVGDSYNRVVIANRASGTISAINSDNNEVIGTFEMPNNGEPMYAVYNSDNNTVLVGDYAGKVVAFDAIDYSVRGYANAGAGVFHMWLSPNNKQLWVNNELDRTISVINPSTLANIATVHLPQDLYDAGYKPHDVILMPNNAAAFVTLLGSGEYDYVIKYDTESFLETGRAAVGTDPHVSLTSANSKLYVASQGSSELKVLKRSDLSEVTTVTIPNAHGLGMSADGSYLYVGNISEGGNNATYTLDLSSNSLVGSPVDAPFSAPHNYAVSGDNQKLYLTHSGSNNQVSVYNLSPTPTLVTSLTVGNNPFGLVAYSAAEPTAEVTDFTICAGDGISDAFSVNLNGQSGSKSAWVITDTNGNILGLPAGPPFDLEGAGAGTCLVWHLSYEEGLSGVAVGANTANLQGCYDLSNPVTVYRFTGEDCEASCDVDGGHIYTNDATTICAGDGDDDFIDVNLSGTAGANSAWVITDTDGNILGLPAAPPFNFEGAGEGVCLIWHMSFEGAVSGVELGENVADFEGCYAFSNEIKVVRRTSGQVCGRYNNNSHNLSVDLAPNPVSSDLRVDITISEGGNFRTSTIEILTALGRRVYRRTEATYDGDNRVNINVSELEPGVYFLRVRNGSQREVVRFIKQ